ncbi:MAG: AtpZ/AtpI family protein [Phycisphaerales bacterium JB065]
MPITEPKSDKSNRVAWTSAAIGFEFAAAIGGLAVIGYLIDRKAGTEPTWTIILTTLGFIGGSYNLFKEVRKLQARIAKRTVRKDSGEANPQAASAEVAAKRGRPRPTGRVDLFGRQAIDIEDLNGVELDWPEDEKDQIEKDLRDAGESGFDDTDAEERP